MLLDARNVKTSGSLEIPFQSADKLSGAAVVESTVNPKNAKSRIKQSDDNRAYQ